MKTKLIVEADTEMAACGAKCPFRRTIDAHDFHCALFERILAPLNTTTARRCPDCHAAEQPRRPRTAPGAA